MNILFVNYCIKNIKILFNFFFFYWVLYLFLIFFFCYFLYEKNHEHNCECIGLIHTYKYLFLVFEMIETCCWIVLFVLVFIIVHYQFKYCIPVGLIVLKFLETCFIVFLIRMYVTYRVYNHTLDWLSVYKDLKNFYTEL